MKILGRGTDHYGKEWLRVKNEDGSIVKVDPSTFKQIEVKESGGVACVVTCHNYSCYLDECLDSLDKQTHKFTSVIVVDDGSADGDIVKEITKHYGFKYHRVNVLDPNKARNAGLELVGGVDWVLFMDADNYLGPFWLEKHLDAANLNTGLVYSRADVIDEFSSVQGSYKWVNGGSLEDLPKQNFIDTCALVRMEVFQYLGKLSESIRRFTDWQFAIQVRDMNWGIKFIDDNLWYYRLHDKRLSEEEEPYHAAYKDSAHVAIISILSGRDWCFDKWCNNFSRLGWDPNFIHCVFVDNSNNVEFTRKLKEFSNSLPFSSITIVSCNRKVDNKLTNAQYANNTEARTEKAAALGRQITHLYNHQAIQHVPAHCSFVLTIEDDIESKIDDIIPNMISKMTPCVDVVAGVVPSRYIHGTTLSFLTKGEDLVPINLGGTGIQEIDACGFGMTLWRRPCWKHFPNYTFVAGKKDQRPWPDIEFCRVLREEGYRILHDWSMDCYHWDKDYIDRVNKINSIPIQQKRRVKKWADIFPSLRNEPMLSEPLEYEMLCYLSSSVKGPVLEIGRFNGMSTLALSLSGNMVYSIDLCVDKKQLIQWSKCPNGTKLKEELQKLIGRRWENIGDIAKITLEKHCNAYKEGRVKLIDGDSKLVAEQVPNELAMVFIDGDHSYEGAKADMELYIPKLRKGGLLVLHDFDLILRDPSTGVDRAAFEFSTDWVRYGSMAWLTV